MRVTSFSGERLARIKSGSGGSKSFRSLNVEQLFNVYRFSITKELNGHLVVMQNYGRTETKSGESEF